MDRRGLSPIIATVLLISLVLVLASIIFLWARAFLPEQIQKFESPIEDACKNVVFDASVSENIITMQNNGNVPIQTIQVGIRKGIGSLSFIELTSAGPAVVAGGSRDFSVSGINSGDDVTIIPVLLGKTNNGELKGFACGDGSSKTVTAG